MVAMIRTPSANVGAVYRRVNVATIDFAHEAIDLRYANKCVRVTGNHDGEESAAWRRRKEVLTFSSREQETDSKRDWQEEFGARVTGRFTTMCSPAREQLITPCFSGGD